MCDLDFNLNHVLYLSPVILSRAVNVCVCACVWCVSMQHDRPLARRLLLNEHRSTAIQISPNGDPEATLHSEDEVSGLRFPFIVTCLLR